MKKKEFDINVHDITLNYSKSFIFLFVYIFLLHLKQLYFHNYFIQIILKNIIKKPFLVKKMIVKLVVSKRKHLW